MSIGAVELSEGSVTRLKLLQGYSFRVQFDSEGTPDMVVDEPKPVGEGLGPNSTRLLSAAVGQCLSSSLLYCLRKARIRVTSLEMEVKSNLVKSEKGQTRLKSLDVQIHLDVNPEDRSRATRCLRIFEEYCTVTPSVRSGIEVKVNIV
jgi:uncharacterized OsmC-like protein